MSLSLPQHSLHRRSSTLATIAGSAVLILALCAGSAVAAQAPVGLSRHQNWSYKVEQHVTLEDQTSDSFTVTCKPGDIVIDGMYRIDHVDQDTGTLQDVHVLAAYPSASDRYFFAISNEAEGNAQLKLFLTCLDNQTSTVKGHSHTYSSAAQPLGLSVITLSGGSFNQSASCGADQIVIAPGFNTNSGYVRFLRSKPLNSLVNSWRWRFYTSDPASVTFYHRCLNVKTSLVLAHRHKILYDLAPILSTVIPPSSIVERKVSCDEHEKALLHWFDLDPFEDNFYLFFHGMDPRPKERAYRVENTDPSFGRTAQFSAVCFADRTSKKVS